jgi:hypothetical protein
VRDSPRPNFNDVLQRDRVTAKINLDFLEAATRVRTATESVRFADRCDG